MAQPKLYLLMGYPGAGKTTTGLVIRRLTGATYLSSDELRAELFAKPTFSQVEHSKVYKELDRRLEHALKNGRDVIYDANLNRHRHRQEKYDICRRTGAQPLLLWVQANRTIAKQRAAHTSRQHLWPPDETPEAMFDRIASVIEPPKAEEAHIIVDGTRITPGYMREILGL